MPVKPLEPKVADLGGWNIVKLEVLSDEKTISKYD